MGNVAINKGAETEKIPSFTDPKKVVLLKTATEDALEMVVTADILTLCVKTYLRPPCCQDSVCVDRQHFTTQQAFAEAVLANLIPQKKLTVTDAMQDKFRGSDVGRQWLRDTFPAGTRVCLEHMDDVQAPPKDTCGTVEHIDDAGQIHVRWDNGSGLALLFMKDKFTVLSY